MVLETMTLQEMRVRIKEEFGIAPSDTLQDELIRNRVNEAFASLIRERQNWPWQRKTTVLDLEGLTSVTGDFVQGSRSVANVSSLTGISLRSTIVVGTSTDAANYFVVEAINGTTLTLDRQYLGATGTGKSMSVGQGFIQLPEDFMRLDQTNQVEDLVLNRRFQYVPFSKFDKMRRRDMTGNSVYYYTVQSDPINLDQRWYLGVYPMIDVRTSLRGSYFFIPQQLVNDEDEPPMPINDRPVLLLKAKHLYARSRNDPRQNAYFAEYQQALGLMLARYELSDDECDDESNVWRVPHLDVQTDPFSPDWMPQ